MTNAQRIRSMTDEGLARWLIRLTNGDENIKFCKVRPECDADLEQDRDIPQERWGEGRYALHHQGLDDCLDSGLGKTWFLTKEEAEAALKGENHEANPV